MVDLIGDVHGHAGELEALLLQMGYHKKAGVYEHPTRKAIFVGDYIDRGPKIRETLTLIRAMVEKETAIALIGNHEYNALCFHFQESEGGHLRKHLIKNIVQHYQTLKQFQNRQQEYEDYLDWFKSLPLFYETEAFRVVHACWDESNIDFLRNNLENDRLTDELIHQSVQRDTRLNKAIEQTLKGKELDLPEGHNFEDKDGTKRTAIRIKWWEEPAEMTYQSISVEPIPHLPELPIKDSGSPPTVFYPETGKRVFFGHYWLNGDPVPYRKNVCCLDYSVAKGGKLVAYRFDGEEELDKKKLVWV